MESQLEAARAVFEKVLPLTQIDEEILLLLPLPENYVSRILQVKFDYTNVDIWTSIKDSNERIIRALTWEEFHFVIKNLKIKSAHGPNFISNLVISKLPILSLFRS